MSEKHEPFEALLRSKDAARRLGISEWLLRRLAHEGELPYIQRAATSPMLFDPADLRKWIEREKVRAGA
jgi:excisionase family DNA binding protein